MFKRLISLVRQEKVTPFIGAGFSYEACAPSVRVLRQAILDEIQDESNKKLHEEDNLDALTEFFVEEECLGSRNQMVSILQKAFDFTPKSMKDHEILAKIPHFKNIFTTNYDTLLEDSYQKEDCLVVRNDADYAYMGQKPFTVYKVHGDFTAPDSVVITSSDYKKFFDDNQNPLMWNKVVSEFTEKHVLFIGYSLEDGNILSIIKKVSEALGKNQKDMFLIAPSISDEKRAHLKDLKVHYIEAVASDFLTKLIKDLEDNISSDFENNLVSGETYTRFWLSYNAVPTVSMPKGKKNIVDQIKPIPGQELIHQLQMSLPKEVGLKLQNMDFVKYGIPNVDSFYHNIPCFKISGKELLSCKHLINGIVLNKNIKEITILPTEDHYDLSIRIPSRDFFELKTAKVYRLNGVTALFNLDCDVFILSIKLTVSPEGNCATLNFDFEPQETYKDNSEAIKWIELPSAFFNNEDVIIQELSMQPMNTLNVLEKDSGNQFEQMKQYYHDIKTIELASGKKFKAYNKCTDESCRIARYIVSYLCRQFIPIKSEAENGFDFSTKSLVDKECIDCLKSQGSISFVKTDHENLSYSLNKRIFTIPYQHSVLNSCSVTRMEKNEDGTYSLDFHYPKATYSILFSNKSAYEEFPQMRPFHTLKGKINDK